MHFLELSLPTAAENVALDEALLLEAEAGRLPPVLRIWEQHEPAVVVGSGVPVFEEVEVERCRAEQVPIVRRVSGGGAVLLGRGCLCYSLILPTHLPGCGDIRSSVSFVLTRTCQALEKLGLNVHVAGGSDLVLANRKVGGSAQRRMLRFFLLHGTLLYAMNLDLIQRYLRIPKRQPEYRQGRSHRDFVGNLPGQSEAMKKMLRLVWDAREALPSHPASVTQNLVRSRYTNRQWTYRR